MQTEFDETAQLWQQGLTELYASTPDVAHIKASALAATRVSVRAQFQTVLILVATLVMLVLYFQTYLTREVALADFGKGLMVGALLGRIILEVISIGMARRVRVTEEVRAFVRKSLALIRYREAAIRWFALVGGLTYSLGYAVLVYMYRAYLSPLELTALVVSYLVAAVVVGCFMFLGYREERARLRAYEALVSELSQHG